VHKRDQPLTSYKKEKDDTTSQIDWYCPFFLKQGMSSAVSFIKEKKTRWLD
jgi:hypothetical protein